MRRSVLIAAALATAGLVAACGDDDSTSGPATERFRATMNGASERPSPRTTPATGVAEFTLRRDSLAWTVTLANATNVTASHIHIGGANSTGGILLGLASASTPGAINSGFSGVVTRATYTPPGGALAGVTFDSLLTLMRHGDTVYVNVHTNNTANDPTNNTGPGDFPAGEIRGQVARLP